MASAFINASFANLKGSEGPCELVGYLCRTRFTRKRTRRAVDFVGIADDLVYHRVRLPEGAPEAFFDPETLSNAVEAAETERMRKTRGRKHWPQTAAVFIVALPPDGELTLDEAIEAAEDLVDRIIGERRLAVVVAIHDPAMATPGATNRHAHIVVFLREVDRNGFGKKTRNLFARARLGALGQHYVAEGVHWPGLSFDLQQQFLFELATDTIVAPSAPCPGQRLPLAMMHEAPEIVAAHRREVRDQNIEFIYGPADALVDRLLRGRGAAPVAELRHLLARFIDGEPEQRDRLAEIFADRAIVALTAHAGEARPSRLTTRTVYELMSEATGLVDRAAGNRQATDGTTAAPSLAVVSEPTAAAVDRSIVSRVDVEAPLLVGTRSDCASLQKKLAPLHPALISVAALLHSVDGGARGAIPRVGLIVVPCSHTVPDQALAAIITAAESQGSRLLLGYTESAGTGIAAHRLAAYAADALAPSNPDRPHWVECQLRSGLVDRAIAALDERGALRFAAAAEATIDSADFVVCDGVKRTEAINARMSTGAATNQIGQWIVIARTDYSVRPPVLVEGRLAQVIESSADGQTMRIRLVDGSTMAIDPNRHPVRPAFAIGVREARRAPPASRLAIELTQRKYAWAALLLAASRESARATVRVDPTVARDVEELSRVVRGTLPAALPIELIPIDDLEAIVASTLQGAELEDWIEYLPEPEVPPVASSPEVRQTSPAPRISSRTNSLIPTTLHPDLRSTLARAVCEPGLLRLSAALARHNPERQRVADRLLQLCEADSPTRQLIDALIRPDDQAQRRDRLAELDLPNALVDEAPRRWGHWQLYECSIDLRTMGLIKSSHWHSAFEAVAALQSEAETESSQGPFMQP